MFVRSQTHYGLCTQLGSLVLTAFAVLLFASLPTVAQTYFNDFEGAVGPEWSNTSTGITPAGARRFLGQFGNQKVKLTLAKVPACNVTVSFELFIIRSWDGHGTEFGPDVWDLRVGGGGPTLLHTTFATHKPRLQAYPGTFVAFASPPFHLPHTGAAETNSLGFPFFFGSGDVYQLSFTFAHAGGPLALVFSGSGLQSRNDESWGLDNVLVNCPPDCSKAVPSVDELWPPNHKFVPVTITGVTDPDGDPVTITIRSIFQDEPVDTFGDGSFVPDAFGLDTDTANLRAERSGTKKVPGDGRVYHITFTADDGNGGKCKGTVTVCVPHDQRPGHVCVDGGPLFDSTSTGP